jgi:hypothetical protein
MLPSGMNRGSQNHEVMVNRAGGSQSNLRPASRIRGNVFPVLIPIVPRERGRQSCLFELGQSQLGCGSIL